MKIFCAISVVLAIAVGNMWYIYHIFKKSIFPTVSTWIIFSTATILNLLSFLVATKRDFLGGVMCITDAASCFVVMVVCVFYLKSSKLRFKPFEKYYLASASLIVIFWGISNNAFISNLLFQALITIGILPTVQTLLLTKRNPESFFLWGSGMVASLLSFYPAMGNTLAIIYSLRSLVGILIVLALMIRLELKGEETQGSHGRNCRCWNCVNQGDQIENRR